MTPSQHRALVPRPLCGPYDLARFPTDLHRSTLRPNGSVDAQGEKTNDLQNGHIIGHSDITMQEQASLRNVN
jgi:hypothetical protein